MASNILETQEIVERSLTPTPPTSEQSRDRYYKRLFQGRLVDLAKPKTSKNSKTPKDSSEKSRIAADGSESKSFEKAEFQQAKEKDEETKLENPNVFWTPSDDTLGADISDSSSDLENSGKREIQRKGLYETAYDSVMAKIESKETEAQVHSDNIHLFEGFKKKRKENDKKTLDYLQKLDKDQIECPRNDYKIDVADIGIADDPQQRLWDVACYIRNEHRVEELNQGDTSDLYWIQANLQSLACFNINVWTPANSRKKAQPSEPLPIKRSSSDFFSFSGKEVEVPFVGSLSSFFSAPAEKSSSSHSFDGTQIKKRELKFQNRKES